MDAGEMSSGEFAINFDLLSDDFELVEPNKFSKDQINISEDIDKLLDSVQVTNPEESDKEYNEFLSQQLNVRFSSILPSELDQLEGENEAKSTHWQTNWAVKIMRGNF